MFIQETSIQSCAVTRARAAESARSARDAAARAALLRYHFRCRYDIRAMPYFRHATLISLFADDVISLLFAIDTPAYAAD